MKILPSLAAGAAMLASISAIPANASTLDFLWQWNGTSLHGITTEDGQIVQDANVGQQYGGSYYLFNNQTLTNDFSGAYNFYGANKKLLFTYNPSGSAGNTFFNVPIFNAAAGPISPIPGGTSLSASPLVQNLLSFEAGADNYTLQFQDLAAAPSVPEPATWAMMLAGFGLIGFATRRRSSTKTTVRFA